MPIQQLAACCILLKCSSRSWFLMATDYRRAANAGACPAGQQQTVATITVSICKFENGFVHIDISKLFQILQPARMLVNFMNSAVTWPQFQYLSTGRRDKTAIGSATGCFQCWCKALHLLHCMQLPPPPDEPDFRSETAGH